MNTFKAKFTCAKPRPGGGASAAAAGPTDSSTERRAPSCRTVSPARRFGALTAIKAPASGARPAFKADEILWESEGALQSVVRSQLGVAFDRAQPRLASMGERAANEGCAWAAIADAHGPELHVRDRAGNRIDEVAYHPAYRLLQQLGYGGGIVAATYDPALAAERGDAPRALTFALGYLFSQAESGMYCPVCMTDGAARQLLRHAPRPCRNASFHGWRRWTSTGCSPARCS